MLLLFGIPIGLIISYWCRQHAPLHFKVLAICLQSSGVSILILGMAIMLSLLLDLKRSK